MTVMALIARDVFLTNSVIDLDPDLSIIKQK
jgi:hypothetical protein